MLQYVFDESSAVCDTELKEKRYACRAFVSSTFDDGDYVGVIRDFSRMRLLAALETMPLENAGQDSADLRGVSYTRSERKPPSHRRG